MTNPAQEQDSLHSTRNVCSHPGCGKTFSRKEHLKRHALSHSGKRHVCRVCSRGFDRSDTLRRHVALHGESFKPSPSGRSKRACIACHTRKTKCDGNDSCARCVNKGVECVYEQQDLDTRNQETVSDPHTHEPESVDQSPFQQTKASSTTVLSPIQGGAHELGNSRTGNLSLDSQLVSLSIEPQNHSSLNQARFGDPVGWMQSARLESHNSPLNEEGNVLQGADPLNAIYLELYFSKFHHRWPLVFRPEYDSDGQNLLTATVIMVGKWLYATHGSRESALEMHTKFMDQLFHTLDNFSSKDSFQKSLPYTICEASLLNIVFGVYCGRDKFLSRAIIMKNTLITILREVDFFTPGTPYDKQGTFFPYRQIANGERSRLSAYLFKIDTYLSILRWHSPLLMTEELHYPQHSTYSNHNSNGLDIWMMRNDTEPPGRQKRTIHRMTQSPSWDTVYEISDGMMLVEDIHLGICALHAPILQLSERLRHSFDINNAIQRDKLRRQLEVWKQHLQRVPFPHSPLQITAEQQEIMRYYQGFEDTSTPNQQAVVYSRPRDLYYDTLMLYHLTSLNLYADIRNMRQVARDISLTRTRETTMYGEPYKAASQQRATAVREATRGQNMRRSLYHAASILSGSSVPEDRNSVDPVLYIALSVAELVVWAYCEFSVGCEVCTGPRSVGLFEAEKITIYGAAGGVGDGPRVELGRWCGLGGGARDGGADEEERKGIEKEMETWIEKGGGMIMLLGMQLCRCTKEDVLKRFRAGIPSHWEAEKWIAPSLS